MVAKSEIEGRIQAISQAHGLLTEFGGVEGSLLELIATELKPYEHRTNVTMAGDDIVLTSKANVSVALAIHELATNSAKYGALSTDKGHLSVKWRVTGITPTQELEILWEEAGGPPVKQPTSRGYGTKLIELSLVRGLGAKVDRQFLATGVRCLISVPLTDDIGRLRPSHGLETPSQ